MDLGERRGFWEGAGRSGGRGGCGQFMLYKRRINITRGRASDLLLAIINHIFRTWFDLLLI